MVKHQRRSHQRGIHSSELDDCTSESGSEESPTTPKSNGMSWPPPQVPMIGANGHVLHRAASFADFGQHVTHYGMPQQYVHRHSLSSGGGVHEYHGLPSHHTQQPPLPMHQHDQVQHAQQQQHPNIQMMQQGPVSQHPYYVTEHNNPGVATMNTSPHPSGAHMPPQYHQVPRQGVERLPLEIPYNAASGLNASIQSSPSTFSSASSRSDNAQDGFYTHAPAAQDATYALHSATPGEQQQPQMVAYQGQMAPQPQQMSQPPPPPQQIQQPPPQPQQVHSPHHYQPPQAQPEEQGWYAAVPYQPPVEVTTIHQIPTYGSAVYDPWGPKIEYEDSSMQMPSARIESM